MGASYRWDKIYIQFGDCYDLIPLHCDEPI